MPGTPTSSARRSTVHAESEAVAPSPPIAGRCRGPDAAVMRRAPLSERALGVRELPMSAHPAERVEQDRIGPKPQSSVHLTTGRASGRCAVRIDLPPLQELADAQHVQLIPDLIRQEAARPRGRTQQRLAGVAASDDDVAADGRGGHVGAGAAVSGEEERLAHLAHKLPSPGRRCRDQLHRELTACRCVEVHVIPAISHGFADAHGNRQRQGRRPGGRICATTEP
jgi:hypothetical protein